MKKKQEPSSLEGVVEFMIERFKIPTKKEIDSLVKKTERSLLAPKLPSRTEFNRLVNRVVALEEAVKGGQPARKTAGRAKRPKRLSSRRDVYQRSSLGRQTQPTSCRL